MIPLRWRRKVRPEEDPGELPEVLAARPVTHRAFLKLVVATLGGAGLVHLAERVPLAEATYTPGSPSDIVNTNLTVQGNLVVNQNVGIGVTSPQGKLDIAGDIRINGVQVIGTDLTIKQSYYAQ